MRKQQKQQAEEMVSILEEAHNEIKRYVEQNQAGIVIALLAQCQECAING